MTTHDRPDAPSTRPHEAPVRSRPDLRAVIAVAWIGVAIGLTAVFGPRLGLRGWLWLGMHHLLCAVGAGHELLVALPRRRRARREGR